MTPVTDVSVGSAPAVDMFGQVLMRRPGTLVLRLHCIPPKTSHHAKKIKQFGPPSKRFIRLGDTDKLVEAKETLDALLLPHQPPEPIRGPVRLDLVWTWPFLSSHTKAFRAAGRRIHTTKPDLSNVLKTLEDRLVRLQFIEDDKAVVAVTMRKFWGSRPGIDITISEA